MYHKPRVVLALVLATSCVGPSLAAQPGSSLGPSDYLHKFDKNPFLLATDKQFAPVADFLMHKGKQVVNTVNGHGVDCVKAIYVGLTLDDVGGRSNSATWDVFGEKGKTTLQQVQSDCADGLPHAIQPIAEANGIIPKPKHVVDTKAAMVLDPRVYARAQKMLSPSHKNTKGR